MRPLTTAAVTLALAGLCACEQTPLQPDGGPADSGPLDGGPVDVGPLDADPDTAVDASSADGGLPLDAEADLSPPDAHLPDVDPADADLPDAGPPSLCPYPVHELPSEGGTVVFDTAAYDIPVPAHVCRLNDTRYGRVVHIELDRAATVGVHAPGGSYSNVRTACYNAEVACADSLPARFDLEPGAYFITVTGNPRSIEIELDPPALTVACRNGIDDDLDGLVDLDDPGCIGPGDPLETDIHLSPACADGVDNDGDGAIDWPDDLDCTAAGALTEATCGPPGTITLDDALPYELDAPVEGLPPSPVIWGATRYVFRRQIEGTRELSLYHPSGGAVYRGCAIDPEAYVGPIRGPGRLVLEPGEYLIEVGVDADEPPPVVYTVGSSPGHCADGRDNDGDGRVDLADTGCVGPMDPEEGDPRAIPTCANGIDDDGDGAIDWPDDPDCTAAGALSEAADCLRPVAVLGSEGGQIQHGHAAVDDASGACDDVPIRGAVFAVDLDRPARLRVEREFPFIYDAPPAMRVRAQCDDPDSEVACPAPGEPTEMLAPGRWYVSVAPPADQRLEADDRYDVIVSAPSACGNGLDDDGDGAVDAADRGCRDPLDDDERDIEPAPACANGADDDGDGAIDYPDDPDCLGGGDRTEESLCGDLPVYEPARGEVIVDPEYVERDVSRCGLDGPVATVAVRVEVPVNEWIQLETPPGATRCVFTDCDAAPVEWQQAGIGPFVVVYERPLDAAPIQGEHGLRSLVDATCRNGEDDDGDGLTDHDDPGCRSITDTDEADPPEAPICANGIDDDGNGAVDYPDDPDCRTAGDPDERGPCDPAFAAAHAIEAPGGTRIIDMNRVGAMPLKNACTDPPGVIVLGYDARAFVEVQVDRPSRLVAYTTHSGFDPALALVSQCAYDPDPSRCDANGGPGFEARLDMARVEPGTHLLLITAPYLSPRLPWPAWSSKPWTTTLVVELQPLQ